MMRVLSVNVGKPLEVPYRDGTLRTGIYKAPVSGVVHVRRHNLDGDGQADLRVHGGEYKAVYAYPWENYSHWQRELHRDDLTPGQFGENLTVEGMTEDTVHIGDIFQIGRVRLQVTQPRGPCYKLDHKMGIPDFAKSFLASHRVGFYLRVLDEGDIRVGDTIERVHTDPAGVSVAALNRLGYFDRDDLDLTRRALMANALPPTWRERLAERLAAAEGRTVSP